MSAPNGGDNEPDPESGVVPQRPNPAPSVPNPLSSLSNETVTLFGRKVPLTVLFPILGLLAVLAFGIKGIILAGGAGALFLLCRSDGSRSSTASSRSRSAARPSGPRIRTLRDLPQAPSGG
eukprot:CAMPEP_0196782842 /NCGR_PEP_ID=MMETSP1104-20130614/12142_1 /TAXON_ID=33652 /ORGANISM="Cafeteria sp., Strain Caron Lab Isolate" /LENGTH=120 /DNA_ID=CAMNT_0042153087 /DNA_START=37 /DNA_END=399 /DNA_ORIENTATION=+